MQQDTAAAANTQELAQQRTAWASERTRLANERTLVAWLRTGLAVVAFGAVVPRVLSGAEPQWLVAFISLLFVVSGSVVLFFGVRNYREMTIRLEEEQVGLSWWLVAILAGALQLGAVLILILFLFG
jgi:putative membrane protein